MNSRIKAVSLCEKYTDVPVIVTSLTEDNKGNLIILVYSGFDIKDQPEFESINHDTRLLRLCEVELIRSIIHDGGKCISRLFNQPIVLKDDLHIMPLIIDYVNNEHFSPLPGYGNITVYFQKVSDSYSFYVNSLLPFLRITKDYLVKPTAFCLYLSSMNGDYSICACWEQPDLEHSYTKLLRHLVETIPESNLHAIKIDYHPIPSNRISFLRQWSSACFLSLFSDSNDSDIVIREVFFQYISIAVHLYDNPIVFLSNNRVVLDNMISYSISSFTKTVIPNSFIGGIVSKVLSEYRTMMRANIEELSLLLSDTCSQWSENSIKCVPHDVVLELSVLKEKQEPLALLESYQSIITSSLLNPFHYGFFPYCINELLPIVCHL